MNVVMPIPGFGQVGKPPRVQDGTLYNHLQGVINGKETTRENHDTHQLVRKWRQEYSTFYFAEAWAKHARQLLQLGEKHPSSNWQGQHEYAANASKQYYAEFVHEYKHKRYLQPKEKWRSPMVTVMCPDCKNYRERQLKPGMKLTDFCGSCAQLRRWAT